MPFQLPLPAEGGDLLAVDLDGQFLQYLHGMRTGFGQSKDFAIGKTTHHCKRASHAIEERQKGTLKTKLGEVARTLRVRNS